MLYMVNEYKKEYPDRPMAALEKFGDCTKYLHEMTLEEINNETKNWDALSFSSIGVYRQLIMYYLRWLQTKGVKTEPMIAKDIIIPIVENQYLIYSTDDLAFYYEKLFKFLEKQAVKEGGFYNKERYYLPYATGILAFYGLTDKEIAELDLSDVQLDGVYGFDLPLTDNDLEILNAYKKVDSLSRNVPLLGTKYIRSTLKNSLIDNSFMSRPIRRIQFDEENEYLKQLLSISNLRRLGKFARIYDAEKRTGQILEIRCKNPEWFSEIIKAKSDISLAKAKKEYIEYRIERNNTSKIEYIPEKTVIPTPEQIIKDDKQDKINAIKLKFADITQQIIELKAMIDAL